jgi:hypothetical protein
LPSDVEGKLSESTGECTTEGFQSRARRKYCTVFDIIVRFGTGSQVI